MRRNWIGIFLAPLWLTGIAACSAPAASCPAGDGHVTVVSAEETHCFEVDIADTPEKRSRGLMHVRHMDEVRGMLFLFERPAMQSFWMKNTYISLDILFIGPDGRIVNIAARTEPLSEESIPSAAPALAVLEINGGLAEKLNIRAGDRVRHPALDGEQASR